MTEECQLMLLVQQGQLDKLAPLFEAYKVRLFNYFLQRGHSRSASEDLVQETFTKVLAYRDSFGAQGTFRSWLYGVARNTAVDHYRKHKQSDQHESLDAQQPSTESGEGNDLTEKLHKAQQQDIFQRCLAQISVQDSEIILLSRVHQLKYEDIAMLLGCNVNTLKSKMQAALNRLHQKYQDLTNEGDPSS
ncbi:MAG: sigma-70 family RNA polymerase sigma factor [Aliiglaciecola sp.]|uniref:RNA polymerase sigma factor n=1 Tax=Aliiglaciecola sp. M165 TaxID=2593649 RepID=UPI00117D1D96|nr:RNA polymerase sigma factor [Aliiglaciecola sp. M165]TRY31791.1 RNA polymerase sigma factor [Aliiglaciecola sp. M165]